MTFIEMKQRIHAVLNTIDAMSKNGTLEIKGIGAMQEMAGCVGVLSEIMNIEQFEVRGEEQTK